MRILLAPMEGVVDHTLRDLLTRVGGIDRCVTEFVRVSIHPLSPRVFYRFCPELHHRGLTPQRHAGLRTTVGRRPGTDGGECPGGG